MTNDSFTFQHLETDRDILENLEMMRTVFGQNSGVDLLVKKLVYNHPEMTLKNHFIAKHHGKIVSTLNLIPQRWIIGNVELKVAEMGNVATLEEYRNQGLVRRLVNEYHKDIANEEYDLSVIEGIPYFYRQFGYEYALPLDEETKISLEKLPQRESKVMIRRFTNDDIPVAMELLGKGQSKFYVRSLRDKRIWQMQHETGLANDYEFICYAVEENDNMIAYFRTSLKPEKKEIILREATDVDQPAMEAIFSFMKAIGNETRLETLTARISYRDPLAKSLVALGAEQEMPPYAWQIRITDCASLLKKMRPLFEARLAASEFGRLTESLTFNFRRFAVQITVQDGLIIGIEKLDRPERSMVGLNPPASTQLLLGYRSREELQMIFPDFNVRHGYEKLVDILFPKLPSFIHSVY